MLEKLMYSSSKQETTQRFINKKIKNESCFILVMEYDIATKNSVLQAAMWIDLKHRNKAGTAV